MAQREANEREGRSLAKYLRISPQKARRAADLVRNQPLLEARRRLAFTPIRGAQVLSKVLESAVANATHNFDLPEDRLYVHRVFVDEGMTIKRWIPRAYGRANRIRRRTSHITVVVRAKLDDTPVPTGARTRRRRAAGSRSSTAGSRSSTAGSRSSTAGSRSSTAGSRSSTAGSRSSKGSS